MQVAVSFAVEVTQASVKDIRFMLRSPFHTHKTKVVQHLLLCYTQMQTRGANRHKLCNILCMLRHTHVHTDIHTDQVYMILQYTLHYMWFKLKLLFLSLSLISFCFLSSWVQSDWSINLQRTKRKFTTTSWKTMTKVLGWKQKEKELIDYITKIVCISLYRTCHYIIKTWIMYFTKKGIII